MIALILVIFALGLWLAILICTLNCVKSVLKRAIAVPLSARSMTMTTVVAVQHPVVVVQSLAVKWQLQWHKVTLFNCDYAFVALHFQAIAALVDLAIDPRVCLFQRGLDELNYFFHFPLDSPVN